MTSNFDEKIAVRKINLQGERTSPAAVHNLHPTGANHLDIGNQVCGIYYL